jgi:hypothetical protein
MSAYHNISMPSSVILSHLSVKPTGNLDTTGVTTDVLTTNGNATVTQTMNHWPRRGVGINQLGDGFERAVIEHNGLPK